MPEDFNFNQVAATVNEKLAAGVREATGAINGISGSIAATVSPLGSAMQALTTQLGSQMGPNMSPQGLSTAVSQFVKTLDQTTLFRGLPAPRLDIIQEKPEQTRQNEGAATLKFPSDLGKHFVQLTFKSFSQNSPVDRVKNVQALTIQLPMTPNLQETYSVSYNTPSMEVLGGAADEILKKTLAAAAAETGVVNTVIATAQSVSMKSLEQLGGVVAGTAAKTALGLTGGIGVALQKNIGVALNPNLAVLFNQMQLRSHSFTFRLFPKTPNESATIKKIVKEIRNRIIPKKLDTQFLGYPDKVDIDIYPSPPYDIKTCVVTGMSVNYAPNGVAFFKGTGSNPVQVDITLQFMETEIFVNDMTGDKAQ
jgi:hypothetical protein